MKDLPIPSIIAIVFGIIILLVPQLLAYLVAIYLILTGFLAISKK